MVQTRNARLCSLQNSTISAHHLTKAVRLRTRQRFSRHTQTWAHRYVEILQSGRHAHNTHMCIHQCMRALTHSHTQMPIHCLVTDCFTLAWLHAHLTTRVCTPVCSHARTHACACICTYNNQIYCQTVDEQYWGATGQNLRVPCVLPGGLECQNFDNLDNLVPGCSDYKVQRVGSHAHEHAHKRTRMRVRSLCMSIHTGQILVRAGHTRA